MITLTRLVFSVLIMLYRVFGEDIYNESGCTCVPFYLCTINDTINTNGEGIIDIRVKSDQVCESYLERCCNDENLLPLARSPRVPSTAHGCGYRNADGVGFKITGDSDNEAQFGEFPWMIAIFRRKKNETKHMYRCGGSLIHPQVVLTAAHCASGIGDHFKIRAGEWDSQTTNEIFQHQNRDVSSLVIHPHYNKGNLQNDVALLFLQEPLTTAPHINTVCLPPQGTVAAGSGCFVTGWGKTKFDPGSQYQTILKRIEMPVVSREGCQNAFRQTRLGKSFQLHRTFMCAGGEEGVDSCSGDGGGPLVCPIAGQENRYQQVGIVAWGIGCGNKDVPGAYVDVAYFRNWVDRHLNNKHLNISEYQY